MAKVDVVCPRCSETQGVIRNGHSSSGTQVYRCKLCLKTFQLSYRYNGAKPETHQTIIDMAMNGSGCRDTARVSVLQEMGGWESIEMVRRYAHLAPSHLTEHARQIDAIFGVSVPNLSHLEKQEGTNDA